MGIIATLATITITAVNPTKQFAEARNAQRQSDVRVIADALQQHALDNTSTLASGIDSTLRMIGTDTAACDVSCGEGISDLPTDDLGALWNLDEGTGAIGDDSGNDKNSTTVSGVTYGISGHRGSALGFDGSGYIKFPTIFPDTRPGLSEASNLDELTVSVWVHGDAAPSSAGVVVRQGWGGQFNIVFNDTGGFGFNVHQTRYSGGDYNGNWHGINTGVATFADGEWHHVAGRYDRLDNTLKLDVDGVSYGTYTGMKSDEYLSYAPTTHPPMIGASSGWDGSPNTFLDGEVDEVAIYDRELSDSEILNIAQGNETTFDTCLDLSSALLNDYIAEIPSDPRYGSGAKTYYAVKQVENNRAEVRACGAELGESFIVTK